MSAPHCTRCGETVGGTPGGGHPPARMKGARCGPTARTGHNGCDAPLHRRNEGPHGDLARQPVPARRDVRRQPGRTSPSSPRSPSASSCAWSTTTAPRRGSTMPEVDGFVWHGYLPGRAARPALRLPGARAVRPARAASAATRPSCCSTRTPRRSTAQIDGDESLFSYRLRRPRREFTERRTTASATPCSRSSSTPSSTGATTAPPRHEYHETVIYEAHVKGLTMTPPRRPRGDPRHLRRARATRR